MSCGERRWNLEWDFAPVAASFVLLEMSSAVRVVGAAWRRRRASRARFDAANARAIRDPGSRRAARRFSPGEIRPRRAPLVAGVHRPVASAASSVIYFGGCCFLEEKRRGGVSQRADTRDARGGDDDGDSSRTGRAAWRGPVNARGALRGDSTGRPRRAPRPAGPPRTSGERSRSRGARLVNRARAEDDGRDAAAAAARLAPLEASTAAGSELERILKTDPVAFERALSDQVGSPPRPPPPSCRNPYSRSLRFFTGRPASDFGQPPTAGAGGGMRARARRNAPGMVTSAGVSARRAKARAAGPAPSHRSRVPPSHPVAKKKRNDHFFLAFPARANNASSHEPFTQMLRGNDPPLPSRFLVRSFARWHPTCSTRRSPADDRAPSATASAARSGPSRRPCIGAQLRRREKPSAGTASRLTEYLRLEGVISSKGAEGGAEGGAEASMSRPDESSKGAKNGHPSACEAESNPSSRPNADKAERMILSELADAVAFGAKVHRANELRDAMYLSVVARHCSSASRSFPRWKPFNRGGSSRGSARFRGIVVGASRRGGARRTGAHDRKIARLVRECLPAGGGRAHRAAHRPDHLRRRGFWSVG